MRSAMPFSMATVYSRAWMCWNTSELAMPQTPARRVGSPISANPASSSARRGMVGNGSSNGWAARKPISSGISATQRLPGGFCGRVSTWSTARTCDRWCAQWRLEAEGGGRRRRGPAGQRCAGFQNEPLDPPVLEVRSAPFMRHGPAQPDLVATLEPVAIAVGRRVVPKVLEVLHGRDAAAAHLDVLEPGSQLAEYRRQHQLEKRPDLQVPGEIEIADIHEALARLHDVIEFLARHYQKVLPSAHSYLAGRLRSNARFSRGA